MTSWRHEPPPPAPAPPAETGPIRDLTLAVAAICGLAAAILHGFLTWPAHFEMTRNLALSDREWIETALVFESCVVFYAAVYLSGRGFARLAGATSLAAEIRRRSTFHMTLLHVAGLMMFAGRIWGPARHAPVFPHWTNLGIGSLLAGWGVVRLVLALRED